MRATVSIYEHPQPKAGSDIWAKEEPKTTAYTLLVLLLAAASTLGYAAYRLSGMSGFSSPLLKRP